MWEEIPFVGGYINSKAFEDNLKFQLKELIIQNYNHPSICFWGLFNEIRGDFNAITAELNDLAHRTGSIKVNGCSQLSARKF